MRAVALLVLAALFLSGPASAQDRTTGVLAAIEQFFDGMRAGDSTMVRSSLHPDARFLTSMVRDGEPMLHAGNTDRFVEAVGASRDEIWNERVWNVEVRLDDDLAQVWMNYAFFLGEELSHCGVNAMQLVYDRESWRIIQLTDTRRTEPCELPEGL